MSENREIARAAGLVGFFTFLSRIGGLIRDAVTGYYFGAGIAADAFFVAFRIPNLLRRFVAEGAMSIALIPVFSDYAANRSREEANQAMSAVGSVMAVAVAVLAILGAAFAAPLTTVFAPGFADEPEKLDLTIRLTRWLFPYIWLVSLVALLSAMLNAYRHFAAPAMSPIFLNIAMITAALASPWFAEPILALSYGVLVGGVVQVALQIPPLLRNGVRLRWRWQPGHDAVKRGLWLMGPTVFGAAVYQINVLISTVLASLLPTGSVSYLWYADRIFEFPLGVFAVALGTAALPSLSAQAARGALADMWNSLAFSIRLNSFINVPAAAGIWLLADPITAVLFERGAFDSQQVAQTAWALKYQSVGLWSVAMVRLLAPAFYALGDTRTPVVSAAFAFVANVVFSLLLMGPVSGGDSALARFLASLTETLHVADLRHAGLACATSLASTVNLVVLAGLLHRRLPDMRLAELAAPILRQLVATAAMVVPVSVVAGMIDWPSSGLFVRLAALGASVGAGALTYGAVSWLAGSPELEAIAGVVRRRIGGSRK